MFMGPYDQGGPYNMRGITGTRRFLDRVWTLVGEFQESKASPGTAPNLPELNSATHKMIKSVSLDLHKLGFNTAIASLMEYVNTLYKLKVNPGWADHTGWQAAFDSLVKVLAPFAPHFAEELWGELGHDQSVHLEKWPVWDEKYLNETNLKVAVQVNGKLRGEIELSPGADEAAALDAVKANPKIAASIEGKDIAKTIYVPGKILNLVIK
jgi:leucyl-tRNA synthetase